jgi:hypothetical protein
MEPILQRLDKLALDEVQASGARTLEVVYGLVQHRRRVIDGKKTVPNGASHRRMIVHLDRDDKAFGRQGPTGSRCAFTHEN